MAAPTPKKLSATTTESVYKVSKNSAMVNQIHIKNEGDADVLIDFDRDTSSDSYNLQIGETFSLEFPFVNFHYKTASGSATLQTIIIKQ